MDVIYDYQIQFEGEISWSGSWDLTDPVEVWLTKNISTDNWFFDRSTNRMFFRDEEDKVRFILQWM